VSVLGADGTRARVTASQGWRRAWLLASCVLLIGSGACTGPLLFLSSKDAGAGGKTPVNTGDGGADVPGSGGIVGTGGTTGVGGTIGTGGTGTGGTGTGGTGTGGTGPIDARMDVPRDVGPDIRDTGIDLGGQVVCTTNAQCSRVPGLVCLTSQSRCVECVGPNDCQGTKKFCTTDNRCVECMVGTDCPVTPGTNSAEHGSVCFMNHCLNGCSDDTAGATVCPVMGVGGQTCITGSMGSGPDLCLYCTGTGQGTCAAGLTCVSPGVCVGCQSNANCGATQVCDTTVTQRCQQCRDSRDCAKFPSTPLCNPTSLTCM